MMPSYVNVGGRMCVKTHKHGYVPIEEYAAMLRIDSFEAQQQKDKKATEIQADVSRISNAFPQMLPKEEVLDVFVQYIHKYRSYCTKFDIPVGTKYEAHHSYILERLQYAFPDIQWSLSYRTTDKIVCHGELR